MVILIYDAGGRLQEKFVTSVQVCLRTALFSWQAGMGLKHSAFLLFRLESSWACWT